MMFWPEMNIFPYVSCVFSKTICRIQPDVQTLQIGLKSHGESFKSRFNRVKPCHNIVSGSFPVLEATYAKIFSIFEIYGQS